jgi:hypothetical protein
VVDHEGEVAITALVGDLIDPDPPQPVQPFAERVNAAYTRVMIDPTVRRAIRISSMIAVLELCVASHATCSPKDRVC